MAEPTLSSLHVERCLMAFEAGMSTVDKDRLISLVRELVDDRDAFAQRCAFYESERQGPGITEFCGVPIKEAMRIVRKGIRDEIPDLRRDAARYRWLRERDLDTIDQGGVFAGSTPDNVVLNGEDLYLAVDEGVAS